MWGEIILSRQGNIGGVRIPRVHEVALTHITQTSLTPHSLHLSMSENPLLALINAVHSCVESC